MEPKAPECPCPTCSRPVRIGMKFESYRVDRSRPIHPETKVHATFCGWCGSEVVHTVVGTSGGKFY